MALHPYRSPLRYPGGKRKLAQYICRVFEMNGLCDGHYIEPYCGGASVAWALLAGQYAGRVYLNDADPAVYAFWYCVLYQTDELLRFVRDTPVTMKQWHRQRQILADPSASRLELGQACFFLNRTNRSGILTGGVIGGQQQDGSCQVDDRFNREDLSRRIQKIAYREFQIRLYNLDAPKFLEAIEPEVDICNLIYLDPPYYEKGQGLYANAYGHAEHAAVADMVGKLRSTLRGHWIVSYDNVPAIRALYQQYESLEFNLHYSAQTRQAGDEVMFFSPRLYRPEVTAKMVPVAAPRPARAPELVLMPTPAVATNLQLTLF
jgi:DNA adenine methylase